MLKYINTQVVFREFPDETTLAFNISNCPIHCPDCHSKYLWEDTGTNLTIDNIISELNKYNAGEPRYYKNLNMILRRYNESIISTTLPKLSDKDIILVPDFDSLEKVAYRINKPITFTEVKKGKESIFTVIGDKEAYVFRLKDF